MKIQHGNCEPKELYWPAKFIRRTLSCAFATSFLLLLISTSEAAPPSGENHLTRGSAFVPGQAIVGFKNDHTIREGLEGLTQRSLGNRIFLIKIDDLSAHTSVDHELITWELIERLLTRDDVEFAHPNYYGRLATTQNKVNLDGLSFQWNLEAINIEDAWAITMGEPNVRIAIIDTGRTNHPDLLNKWHPLLQYNSADTTNSSVEDTGYWSDSSVVYWRHGTHVASIAGSAVSNAADGTPTTGACPDCTLIPIRAFGDTLETAFTMETLIVGIQWAVTNADVDIINLSLEFIGKTCSHPETAGVRETIESAIESGVHVVAAAGNFPGGSTLVPAPASCPGVISVAALDQDLNLASYSNYHNVTLAAPGGGGLLYNAGSTNNGRGAGINCPNDPESSFNPSYLGVVAAWTTSPFVTPSNAHCHRHLSGTSMATPHVAGVIGLLLSIDPDLSPAEIQQILEDSTSPLPGCGSNCGAGLLNAGAAVSAITDDISWLPAIIQYILQ